MMNIFDWFIKKLGSVDLAAVTKQPQSVDQPIKTSVDWSNSEAHLILLEQFLNPKVVADMSEHWDSLLGESAQATINRYIGDGILVPISLRSKVAYGNNIPDLKKLLKKRGLKVGGNKTELLNRLMDADEHGLADRYKADTMYECSSEVKPRVLQYSSDKKAALEKEFHAATYKALAALRIKDFAKASHIIGTYLSAKKNNILHWRLPNPMGISVPPRTVDEDVTELKMIFSLRPKILSGLSESDWEQVHIVSALGHLLHGGWSVKWLPEWFVGVSKFDASTTLLMMQFHISHIQRIQSLRACGITHGEILGGSEKKGSCNACIKISGVVGKLEDLPELPYEKCTCEKYGCRCMVISV